MADITLDRKTDNVITFQYYESDGSTARSLVDCTVLFTVKPDPFDNDVDDSEATITATVTNHTDAGAGQTEITLSDSDTDVSPNNYFYDIKVVETDGNVYRATKGRCRVSGGATNRIS